MGGRKSRCCGYFVTIGDLVFESGGNPRCEKAEKCVKSRKDVIRQRNLLVIG